jgi:polar amino acid transport system substrate-binding protein
MLSGMSVRTLLMKLALAIPLIAFPFTAGAYGGVLDRILQTGTIKIAVPNDFPPFGDLGPDAKLQGYDIETAALIAKALGVKLDLVPASSTERIPYLTSGKVDLLISSLGKDMDREKVIDFSIAYAPLFTAIYGRERLAISKPKDLAGRTIAVTRDTTEDNILTKLAPNTAIIKRYDDNAATEMAFTLSQAELIAAPNFVAARIYAQSPTEGPYFKFLLKNSPCYIGVRKGEPDLLARVDAIIAAARSDGSLNKISEQWLKVPLGDPERPEGSTMYGWVLAGVVGYTIILLVIGASVWLWYRRRLA